MNDIGILLRHELKNACKNKVLIFGPIGFLSVVSILFGFIANFEGASKEFSNLILILVSVYFTITISAYQTFDGDINSGFVEQLLINKVSSLLIAANKTIFLILLNLIVILLGMPILSIVLNVNPDKIAIYMLIISLIIPALTSLAVFSAIISYSLKNGAIISILITLPICVSIMLASVDAINKSLLAHLDITLNLKILFAANFAIIPIAIFLTSIFIKDFYTPLDR